MSLPIPDRGADPVPSDALHLRDGLPADLLVLHDDWPRARWPTLPLHRMAAHWLEVHGWFRGLIGDAGLGLLAIRERRVEPAKGTRLVRQQLGTFLTNLHHHHHLESSMAFPSLAGLDPRLTRGFALLDRDHDAIVPLLDATEHAVSSSADLDAIARAIGKLAPLLERHLLDEEDLVVPLLSARRPAGW